MKFEQVCQTMYAYFSQQSLTRTLLPLAAPLMLVCAALRIVDNFFGMDSLILAITYLGFFFFLILTASACNFTMVTAGLGLYTLDYVISFLSGLIRFHSFYFSNLLYILVFGFLTYQALRKSALIS